MQYRNSAETVQEILLWYDPGNTLEGIFPYPVPENDRSTGSNLKYGNRL